MEGGCPRTERNGSGRTRSDEEGQPMKERAKLFEKENVGQTAREERAADKGQRYSEAVERTAVLQGWWSGHSVVAIGAAQQRSGEGGEDASMDPMRGTSDGDMRTRSEEGVPTDRAAK